jgi:hypothetical protein
VGVEAIISAEEILMFKAALEASRYDDATLIYDLCHGFLSLALLLCQETSSSAQIPRRSHRKPLLARRGAATTVSWSKWCMLKRSKRETLVYSWGLIPETK